MHRYTVQSLITLILVANLSLGMAAAPAVGVVTARGSFTIDDSRITGNATLFEGNKIQTGPASSQLQLNNGAKMQLAAESRGIVYRDLKSSSVIVTPDGGLRLLDFDVCLHIGAPTAIYSPGTFGYISRQQRAHEAPRIAHDIYSFGALLYFMATGAEPSEYSRPFDLLHRPPAWLNPAVAPALSAAIERCLDPDPEKRFASMEALEEWLVVSDEAGVRGEGLGVRDCLRTLTPRPYYAYADLLWV